MRSRSCPLFVLAALALLPATTAALQFVESSTGLIPPTLEGGKTEVEFADVDADGNVDLVSIGDHSSPGGTDEHGIMVWFGDGAGNWAVTMTGNFGYGGIALGDLNGDGDLDAAYGMHHDYSATDLGDQLIEAVLGDGTGANWSPWDDGLATAGESWGMFYTDLADFDVDGDLDLASSSFGCCNGTRVYGNDGDGSWTYWTGIGGGNGGDGLSTGDINADGYPDLIVGQQTGGVYLGDGTGHFAVANGNLPVQSGAELTGGALGDIDNDGDLDVAYVGPGASLQVWRWDPSGVWIDATSGLPTSGIAATQLADMDADGWVDVIGLGNGILRVWLGNGGTSWSLAATVTVPSPGSFKALRAGGDVDHNGRPDIAMITEQGSLFNYINRFRVFRETTVASTPAIRFEAPRGGEKMLGGSVRFIEWSAECPGGDAGTVDLEYSLTGPTGPWIAIAGGLPNNGRYQWLVPPGAGSAEVRLRARVVTSGGTAETVTPQSFTIMPSSQESVADLPTPATPRAIPNPSLGMIHLDGPLREDTSIEVVDAAGRLVRVLPRGERTWDGRDAGGQPAPGGVYLLRSGAGAARAILLR